MKVAAIWGKGAVAVAAISIILATVQKRIPSPLTSTSETPVPDEIQSLINRVASRDIKTRVCLNMIAKDEANKLLVQSLRAAVLHVSGYMSCDTGSTDATPRLAQTFFDLFNISGAVEEHEWKDFSHNRNLCLEAGRRRLGAACDYWLLLDADQLMVSSNGTSLTELDLHESSYWLRELCHGSEFANKRLVSSKYDWKYYGKVHEYIAPADNVAQAANATADNETFEDTTGTLPSSIYSIHHSEWNRGFERDAELLESAVAENPEDDRARFYLGNTYRALERNEEAIVQWSARIALGGWQEEIYLSALEIGKMF